MTKKKYYEDFHKRLTFISNESDEYGFHDYLECFQNEEQSILTEIPSSGVAAIVSWHINYAHELKDELYQYAVY